MPYRKIVNREWPTDEEFNTLYFGEHNTLHQIAAKYAIPYSSLATYVKSQGWEVRDFTKSKQRTMYNDSKLTFETLHNLYTEKKLSTFEIAEKLGCSRDSVVRRLNKHGIKIRHSAYVTWSHKLLIRKLKSCGVEVPDEHVNYRVLRYKLDIAFPDVRIGVEVDGRSHFEMEDGFYGPRKNYDIVRDQRLSDAGWRIVHYTDHDIRFRLSWVVNSILLLLGRTPQEDRAPTVGDDMVRSSEETLSRQDKEPAGN
jgi:very-short-patch-repair endonuclease